MASASFSLLRARRPRHQSEGQFSPELEGYRGKSGLGPSGADSSRTGGSQHVTVKHIHQQVNVTEGGQAVVAGDTVTRGPGERRRGMIEK
jgi:hypothetical protein